MLNREQTLYDVLSDRQIAAAGVPENIRVLVAPGSTVVSPELAAAWEKFLARGGKLVLTDDSASHGLHGKPLGDGGAAQLAEQARRDGSQRGKAQSLAGDVWQGRG